MNFDFSDDQKMLAEHAGHFLNDYCTFDKLRDFMDSQASHDADLWRQMVDLGWAGIAVPEAYGGLGMGALEMCLLCQAIGRVLAPVPFMTSACLATSVITHFQTPATKALLSRMAVGEVIVATAWIGQQNSLVVRDGRMTGSIQPVAWLASANYLLTWADYQGRDALVLVDLQQASVERHATGAGSLDLIERQGDATFSDTVVTVLALGDEATQHIKEAISQAAILTAFEQIGAAQRCCEMARDYSLERYTFGRVIGGYQAIKHKLANVAVEIELALSNAYYGAWALVSDADLLDEAAAMARISATEAFTMAAEENLQVHGGIGYTWEANCHFFYQRARLQALNFGDQAYWSNQLLRTT
jgi:acyl-CoA dehydrogenase